MLQIILGYIWHYLVWAWPYFTVIASLALVNIAIFHAGRWVEHRKWRLEIKNGNRLGELVQEQLRQRDKKIKQLTMAIEIRESQTELLEHQQKQLIGLAHQMNKSIFAVNIDKLKRRWIWAVDKSSEKEKAGLRKQGVKNDGMDLY